MFGNGVRVGKIFGINIRVDWSWFFILLLITWNLAIAFAQLHPQWSPAAQWGLAFLATLLFFISVLAHELAHSLVARAQGLPVRNITLFLFGGVSNIQREPNSPKNEFIMAAAGPFISLVIGILLLAFVAGSLAALGQPFFPGRIAARLSPFQTILIWLGSINIILGIFNLIPGFPLDGGRMLRSILWGLTNNLRTATRWAAFLGQAIAWIMIVAGISMAFGVRLPFFGTGLISGLWLAFIGWFLNSASVQSYQQTAIQEMLDGVPVSSLMRQNPPSVEPDCSISDLVHTHMMTSDDQAFPVLDQGRLVGLIALADVRRVPKEEWETVHVSEVMTPAHKLVTVTPQDDAAEAMQTLLENDVRQLPVVRTKPFRSAVPNPSVPGPVNAGAASYGTAAPIPATGPSQELGSTSGQGELLGLLRRSDILRWLQIHSDTPGKNRAAS